MSSSDSGFAKRFAFIVAAFLFPPVALIAVFNARASVVARVLACAWAGLFGLVVLVARVAEPPTSQVRDPAESDAAAAVAEAAVSAPNEQEQRAVPPTPPSPVEQARKPVEAERAPAAEPQQPRRVNPAVARARESFEALQAALPDQPADARWAAVPRGYRPEVFLYRTVGVPEILEPAAGSTLTIVPVTLTNLGSEQSSTADAARLRLTLGDDTYDIAPSTRCIDHLRAITTSSSPEVRHGLPLPRVLGPGERAEGVLCFERPVFGINETLVVGESTTLLSPL